MDPVAVLALMPVGNSLTNSSLMFDEPATPMEKLQN
jgi:hypothetical protein